jgi:hypothetical protein
MQTPYRALSPFRQEQPGSRVPVRSFALMDYIEKALEKLREWVDRVIEALLGPEAQGEPDLIPIPVDEPHR